MQRKPQRKTAASDKAGFGGGSTGIGIHPESHNLAEPPRRTSGIWEAVITQIQRPPRANCAAHHTVYRGSIAFSVLLGLCFD